jgi:hypothetical protein
MSTYKRVHVHVGYTRARIITHSPETSTAEVLAKTCATEASARVPRQAGKRKARQTAEVHASAHAVRQRLVETAGNYTCHITRIESVTSRRSVTSLSLKFTSSTPSLLICSDGARDSHSELNA